MPDIAHPPQTRLERVNGLMMEVAADGPPDGSLVILLHGFPDAWWGWKNQIPSLAAAGFRVLAPNQRGYGRSDKPHGVRAYDLDHLADDVIELAGAHGRKRFHVIGHDWGGVVAWHLAARSPAAVETLVTMNAPHPAVFKQYALRRPGQLARSWYAAMFQLPWFPESLLSARRFAVLRRMVRATASPGTFSDEELDRLAESWAEPGALTAMLNWYRAGFRRRTQSLPRRVEAPTLVLFGRQDLAEQPGLMAASLKLCDRGRLVEFEDASHWVQRDAAAAVNQELLQFLRSGAGETPTNDGATAGSRS